MRGWRATVANRGVSFLPQPTGTAIDGSFRDIQPSDPEYTISAETRGATVLQFLKSDAANLKVGSVLKISGTNSFFRITEIPSSETDFLSRFICEAVVR